MRIVFFETMPGEREAISAHLPPGHEVEFLEDALTPDTVEKAKDAVAVSVFVKSKLSQPLLDQLPELKLITTRSMGYDHIDVEYAKSKGILVNNVQTYASHPVAEFTFALLLSVMRRIYPANRQLRESADFSQLGLKGFNLFGRTIGVAGTGRIGKNVVTIAKGFGMKVLIYDAFPDAAFATEHGLAYVPLEELLAQADVVSLHVPSTKETHHLIDASKFALMKKGAVLINTARGEIVDTHALLSALKDSTLWGAGLDVLEGERDLQDEVNAMAKDNSETDYALLAANHVLIDMPNVVVTPHIAFETVEAMQEISRTTAETIANFVQGKEQKYL